MNQIFRFVFLSTFILSIERNCEAQLAPSILWQKVYGGIDPEEFSEYISTNDGGFLFGGSSLSDSSGNKAVHNFGNIDFWIVKTDNLGNIQWEKDFGGQNIDGLYAIKQTLDNGFIIGGFSASGISGIKTESCRGQADYWVLKLDSVGNIQWQKTIGGTGNDQLNAISLSLDGGYLIGGFSDSPISFEKSDSCQGQLDYWVLKLDSSGNIQWQKTIGGNDLDQLFSIESCKDNGYILCGESRSDSSGNKTDNSRGFSDYWIVKLDSTGNIEWQKTYGGNDADGYNIIKGTPDNGFVIGGYSYSGISYEKKDYCRGGPDYWILKIDSIGKILWQKTFGGSGGEFLTSIALSSDGGYLLGGASESNISGEKTENNRGPMGTGDYWILKIDSVGNIEWQKTIGGKADDELYALEATNDGGYMLGGFSVSPIGDEKTVANYGDSDFWIIKLAGPVGIEETENIEKGLIIFPNPAFNCITVSTLEKNIIINKISLTNTLGQKIQSYGNINSNSYLVQLFGLPSGIYALTIETNEGLVIKKFVKQ